MIQPSRSFFNKADDAAKAKAEQAANAEQSEQNVRFLILAPVFLNIREIWKITYYLLCS